jgi:hypothetical protein
MLLVNRGALLYREDSTDLFLPGEGCKPKPAKLIWLQKTDESLLTTTCQMNSRLCDTSTMSQKKRKICHVRTIADECLCRNTYSVIRIPFRAGLMVSASSAFRLASIEHGK